MATREELERLIAERNAYIELAERKLPDLPADVAAEVQQQIDASKLRRDEAQQELDAL